MVSVIWCLPSNHVQGSPVLIPLSHHHKHHTVKSCRKYSCFASLKQHDLTSQHLWILPFSMISRTDSLKWQRSTVFSSCIDFAGTRKESPRLLCHLNRSTILNPTEFWKVYHKFSKSEQPTSGCDKTLLQMAPGQSTEAEGFVTPDLCDFHPQ